MPITHITDCVTLNNGEKMPWFGLGVFRTPVGMVTVNSVRWSLEAGYRHIDTAAIYKNEEDVGKAVRESGIPRQELFITTKVWNGDVRSGQVEQAFEVSLEKLGMDYVDLYLVHWPIAGKIKDAWRSMEAIYATGRAKAIGVSNFMVHHLEELLQSARTVPAVNQVELHPRLQLPELQDFCKQHGIVITAWRPIMEGKVNDIPEIVRIAEKHGKNPVQTTLRWLVQKGIIAIPKSVHQERILSNAQIFDFELEPEEIAAIDALDRYERMGSDPDNFDF